jgi:hypothetical protein
MTSKYASPRMLSTDMVLAYIAPMHIRAARRCRQRPKAAPNARSKPSTHAKSVDGVEHRYTMECAMDSDTFSIAHVRVTKGEMRHENVAH